MPGAGRARIRWRMRSRLALIALLGVAFLAAWWGRSGRGMSTLREGWQAYARGDWAAATEAARRSLKSAPDEPEAVRLLARASERLGHHSLAVGLFRRLGPAAMQAEDYWLLGEGFHFEGQDSLALSSWLNAERLEPSHPETLASLCDHYRSGGRPLEALRHAERLAEGVGAGGSRSLAPGPDPGRGGTPGGGGSTR